MGSHVANENKPKDDCFSKEPKMAIGVEEPPRC